MKEMILFKERTLLPLYCKCFIIPLCFLSATNWAATFPQPDGGLIDKSRVGIDAPIVPDLEIQLERPLPLLNDTSQDHSKKIKITNVTLSGNSVYSSPHLLKVIETELNAEHNISSLKNIALLLTRYYRKNGYLMATAYVPAQTIENNTLKISILEGYLDKITVDSDNRLSDKKLSEYFQVLKEDPLQSKNLERQLRLLTDRNVSTQLIFSPSETQGATALHVEATDTPLLAGRVSLDNKGNTFTSEYRAGGVLEVNNPFGQGGRYLLSAISGGEKYRYFDLDAEIPIAYDGLTFNVRVSDSKYKLGKDFSNLEAEGDSTSYQLGFRYPITRSLKRNIYSEISYRHGSYLDESLSVDTSDRDIKAVDLTFYGNYFYENKRLDWDLIGTIGNADDQIQDNNSDGSFKKIQASLSQSYFINNQLRVFTSARGQLAASNLPSAEKFSLGGVSGVRAYPQSEANVDNGVVSTIELFYQTTPNWRLSAFYDVAFGKENKFPTSFDTNNSKKLEGVGASINYNHDFLGNINLTAAWRTTSEAVSEPDETPRFWFGWEKTF